MAEYVSGRRLNQQFGVSGVTENDTVINVIGRVAVGIDNTGIGTTSATANIDTSTIRIRDTVIDATGYGGALGYFLTKDSDGLIWTAVPPLNNNAIFVASDEDIIGVSSFTGLNFITNDNYYNVTTNPINSNFADISVDLRWFRDRVGSGGIYTTTVVGIGSTIPRTTSTDLDNIKLDIIGDVSIDGTLFARKIIGDIDVITDDLYVTGFATFTGISTFAKVGIGTTNVVGDDLLTIVGDVGLRGETDTLRVGTAVTISNGIVTATTFDGVFLDLENLNVTGIATINSGIITNLTVTGVSTFIGISTFAKVGIGTTNVVGDDLLTIVGDVGLRGETDTLRVGTAVTISNGIVTAIQFDGIFLNFDYLYVSGIATINSGIITNLTATGVSTFLSHVDVLDSLQVLGISTFADNVDVQGSLGVTGVSTFADNVDVQGSLGVSGVSTFKEHVELEKTLRVSGVSTFADNVDVQGSLQVLGISTFADNVDIQGSLGVSGVSTFADNVDVQGSLGVSGVSTFADNVDIQGSLGVSGVSTFADNVDVQGSLGVSGVSTFADAVNIQSSLDVVGLSSFKNNVKINESLSINKDLDVSGIVTFGTITISSGIITSTSGIASYYGNLIGTAATASYATTAFTLNGFAADELNVAFASSSEISNNIRGGQSGNVLYQSSTDNTSFINNGVPGQVLIFNGSIPIWANVSAASGAFGGIAVYDEGTIVGTSGSIVGLNFVGANILATATSGLSGIATITLSDYIVGTGLSISGISTLGVVQSGDLDVIGHTELDTLNVSIAATIPNLTLSNSGIAVTAILDEDDLISNRDDALATQQSIKKYVDDNIASNVGDVDLNFSADSGIGTVNLTTETFDIKGTANEIETVGSGVTLTIGLPNDVIISNDLTVIRNLDVYGNVTVGGTSAIVNADQLQVKDKDIVLGITTDAFGNDVSTDFTANGGGIAIASTEGSPLVCLKCAGINTFDGTYKQLIWFKEGSFTGLGTDAWLSNYAIGIGSTQVPNGVRLAVGGVQVTDNDIIQISNINASGIITAAQFIGTASTASFATTAFSLNGFDPDNTEVGFARNATNVIGGIGSITFLDVSGITTLGTVQISSGIITTTSGIVTYYGDGSKLENVIATSGNATYAETAGIATNVIGGIGSITSLDVSGITTLGTVQISSGIITSSNPGVTTVVYYGDGSNLEGVTAFYVDTQVNATDPVYPTLAAGVGVNSVGISTNKLVFIEATTRLGIGTTNPVTELHVIGDVTATNFNSTSDLKLKTNIQQITDPLEKLTQIQGVSFNWIENNKPSMGVIADELQKVLPELVSDSDPKTVNYNGLIGLLIECVKQQQEEINSLKESLNN